MTKIDERKIIKYGSLAHTMPLPNVYVTDNKVNSGDLFMIFRTQINDIDALVLIPKIKEQQFTKQETENERPEAAA